MLQRGGSVVWWPPLLVLPAPLCSLGLSSSSASTPVFPHHHSCVHWLACGPIRGNGSHVCGPCISFVPRHSRGTMTAVRHNSPASWHRQVCHHGGTLRQLCCLAHKYQNSPESFLKCFLPGLVCLVYLSIYFFRACV